MLSVTYVSNIHHPNPALYFDSTNFLVSVLLSCTQTVCLLAELLECVPQL